MTNQELVELAATRVMGWELYDGHTLYEELTQKTYHILQSGRDPNNKACRVIFPGKTPKDVITVFFWWPLTSLDDAEILVQKLRDGGEDLFGKFMEYMRWMPESLWGWFDDTKEEKCREIVEAALEAVGVEVKR